MPPTDPDFHVGDIGAVVVLHIQEPDPTGAKGDLRDKDVSTASLLEIDLSKPNGTTQMFTAVFATAAERGNGTGTDGHIKLTTLVATDFPVRGDYHAQAFTQFGSSPRQHAASRKFTVGDLLIP